MLQCKSRGLVREHGPENRQRACSVALYKIPALDDKPWHDTVEMAPLVPNWHTIAVVLARAELSEILGRLYARRVSLWTMQITLEG